MHAKSGIVRVARFGGSRKLDPPGWGILEQNGDKTSDVLLFHGGGGGAWHGYWFLDLSDPGSYWGVADEDVPDEIWASLAKWRLLNGEK
jgi:hypothetical protein